MKSLAFPPFQTPDGDWIGMTGFTEPALHCCTQAHVSEERAYQCAKDAAYAFNKADRKKQH